MYFGCLKLEMSKVYTIRVSYVEIRILEFLSSPVTITVLYKRLTFFLSKFVYPVVKIKS